MRRKQKNLNHIEIFDIFSITLKYDFNAFIFNA